MLAPEPESTDPVNGNTKPERTVVVQEIQDAASEAEDGQEHVPLDTKVCLPRPFYSITLNPWN